MQALFPLAWAFLILGTMCCSVAQAEGTRLPLAPPDGSGGGDSLAKAKAESDAALKKLNRAGRKAAVETSVTVISVKRGNVKELARAVKKMYRGRPGFAVAAVPSLGCLMVRADAKTREEVVHLVTQLL